MYMLYDLKPDESVTGGAWYSEQDFDYDFVEVLSANCLKFLKQKVLFTYCMNVCLGACVCVHIQFNSTLQFNINNSILKQKDNYRPLISVVENTLILLKSSTVTSRLLFSI